MIDDNNNAILLLNARFSSAGTEQVSPLTPGEWGRFAGWLRSQGKRPADLLSNEREALLAGWDDKRLTVERIGQLLERGNAMALALEKWSRAGIWVITRSDADYPRLLKHHLGATAPAVLYGCGNRSLLNQPAIGVVGSRKADQNDLDYASALGRNIAQQACSVVSGCARGIDEASMLGALESEGTAIGVVADSLLQAARARKWRDGLMSNNLVLVSPYYPDAAFSRGNAMGRNKFIYCLSQASLVVHSGKDGGTWSGAVENLKRGWVPLWVKRTTDSQAGNDALVQKGGRWLPNDPLEVDIRNLLIAKPRDAVPDTLFDSLTTVVTGDRLAPQVRDSGANSAETILGPSVMMQEREVEQDASVPGGDVVEAVMGAADTLANPSDSEAREAIEVSEDADTLGTPEAAKTSGSFDLFTLCFYDIFLLKLAGEDGHFTADELSEKWQLPRTLTKSWLSKAEQSGIVIKLAKPVRYVLSGSKNTNPQADLKF